MLTLKEVSCECGTSSSQERTCALILNDLAEGRDHATVVGDRVKLNSRLDAISDISATIPKQAFIVRVLPRPPTRQALRRQKRIQDRRPRLHIDRRETTVGQGTADGTGEGESGVEGETAELLGLIGLDVLLDGIELDRAGRAGRVCGSHCEV